MSPNLKNLSFDELGAEICTLITRARKALDKIQSSPTDSIDQNKKIVSNLERAVIMLERV